MYALTQNNGNRKMERFLKIILWWDNPKGGAFFGVLLVVGLTLALMAVMPCAVYLHGIYHGENWIKSFIASLVGGFSASTLKLGAAVLAYAVFLHVHYSIRLCRFSFKAYNVKSIVFGVLFSAVMVPVCAVKQRDWTAFALAVAALVAALAMQELLALTALAMALGAMFRVKYKKDASRLLAVLPVLLAVAVLLGLHVYTGRLGRQIEADTAELFRAAGVEAATFDDLVAAHTNGVSITEGRYAMLSPKTGVELNLPASIRKSTDGMPPWVVSDEERVIFDAFCATNATVIALLDELTLQRDSRPAGAYENPYYIGFDMNFLVWLNFYRKRIMHAQGDDAAQRIMEDAQRIDNIRHWNESLSVQIRALVSHALRAGRINCLEFMLSSLPYEFLLELRAECRENRVAPEARCAEMIAHETVYSNWLLEEYEKQARGLPTTYSEDDLSFRNNPFSRFNVAWLQREQIANLRDALTIVERLNAPLSDGETRFACMSKHVANSVSPFRLPFNYASHDFMVSACSTIFGGAEKQMLFDTAIAVELYRRKHGALPESLDALAPEFFDAAPVSVFDNAPFTYEHGLVEALQTPFVPDKRKRLYSFNGFRISGSIYRGNGNDKKMRQFSSDVPLEE